MTRRRKKGGLLGQAGMLHQFQGLQENILKVQEEINSMTATATAGGGAVTAVVSGDRRLRSLTIDPEVVDPDDVEMLQDLIVAAVNQGFTQVEQEAAQKMSALTGGLGLDGILG